MEASYLPLGSPVTHQVMRQIPLPRPGDEVVQSLLQVYGGLQQGAPVAGEDGLLHAELLQVQAVALHLVGHR